MSDEATALAVLGIDNVLFTVGDLPAAAEFYGARLGLPLAFRLDDRGIALFRLGDESPGLLLRAVPGEPHHNNAACPRVWLEVADARAAAAELARRGLTPLRDPFPVATGWSVEIPDPWGNVVGFTDYTTMPERGRPARS
jgi:catechol 2,3-dioxygenase-like lactoylglutathione lyase family enzyme